MEFDITATTFRISALLQIHMHAAAERFHSRPAFLIRHMQYMLYDYSKGTYQYSESSVIQPSINLIFYFSEHDHEITVNVTGGLHSNHVCTCDRPRFYSGP